MISHKKMTSDKRYNSSAPTASRPWSVTLLALAVLSIATLNLLRCWQAFAQRHFLSELLSISPMYLALSGLFWGLMGLPLFWSLWKGKNWAPRLALSASVAYSLYYWVDRLLLKMGVTYGNIPFTLIANLAILGLIYWILSRKKAITFFGVLHDR